MALAVALVACSPGSEEDGPTPAPSVTDFTVSGVSVVRALTLAKQELGATFTIKLVPKGATYNCAGIGVIDGAKDEAGTYLCTDDTVAVAETIRDNTERIPPSAVWFTMAQFTARTLPQFDTWEKQTCASGYVAAKSPGFNEAAQKELLGYMNDPVADAFATLGILSAINGLPASECSTAR